MLSIFLSPLPPPYSGDMSFLSKEGFQHNHCACALKIEFLILLVLLFSPSPQCLCAFFFFLTSQDGPVSVAPVSECPLSLLLSRLLSVLCVHLYVSQSLPALQFPSSPEFTVSSFGSVPTSSIFLSFIPFVSLIGVPSFVCFCLCIWHLLCFPLFISLYKRRLAPFYFFPLRTSLPVSH